MEVRRDDWSSESQAFSHQSFSLLSFQFVLNFKTLLHPEKTVFFAVGLSLIQNL